MLLLPISKWTWLKMKETMISQSNSINFLDWPMRSPKNQFNCYSQWNLTTMYSYMQREYKNGILYWLYNTASKQTHLITQGLTLYYSILINLCFSICYRYGYHHRLPAAPVCHRAQESTHLLWEGQPTDFYSG